MRTQKEIKEFLEDTKKMLEVDDKQDFENIPKWTE
jgi:hypothetical protein